MTDLEDRQRNDGEEAPEATASRRALMSKGAIAAAVGAAAGIAMSDVTSAANGDNFVLGQSNTATSTTALIGTSTLRATNGSSSGNAAIYGLGQGTSNNLYGVRGEYEAPPTEPSDPAGVYGLADGVGDGVRGVATGSGVGVYGENDGTDGVGVYGKSDGSGGQGVYGRSEGSAGFAVYGQHFGEGTRSGTGVRGLSDFGTGVSGSGSSRDFLADGSGKIQLGAVPSTPPAPTATGSRGQIARDSDGNLWYCYATNSWRKLAGTETAGSLHTVSPYRAYDSRRTNPDPGKLAGGGQTRVVSIKDSRDITDGSVVDTDLVPEGAVAVSFTITVVNTELPGNLSVAEGDATSTTASTINWDQANAIVANSSIVKLDSNRQIKVFNNTTNAGALTNFIIDITGFWL